jgi:hypothetical protein
MLSNENQLTAAKSSARAFGRGNNWKRAPGDGRGDVGSHRTTSILRITSSLRTIGSVVGTATVRLGRVNVGRGRRRGARGLGRREACVRRRRKVFSSVNRVVRTSRSGIVISMYILRNDTCSRKGGESENRDEFELHIDFLVCK